MAAISHISARKSGDDREHCAVVRNVCLIPSSGATGSRSGIVIQVASASPCRQSFNHAVDVIHRSLHVRARPVASLALQFTR